MTTAELRAILKEDVVAAAPALLGAQLVFGELVAQIVETEAYRGEDDPACHAFGRPKMKNTALYGPPGFAYIYLNYGMHWMLNITAHDDGRAAAVLVRSARPLAGFEIMRRRRSRQNPVTDANLLSGPGKLCQAFTITGEFNRIDLLGPDGLHIIPAASPIIEVVTAPRVGIAEGKWHDVPWRFINRKELQWASKPTP